MTKSQECVEELAEQLEKFIGRDVIVFEKNAFIFATIKDVKYDSVLVLEDANKTQIFAQNAFIQVVVPKLFVSICEITEFAPLNQGSGCTLLNNLKQLEKRLDIIKLL